MGCMVQGMSVMGMAEPPTAGARRSGCSGSLRGGAVVSGPDRLHPSPPFPPLLFVLLPHTSPSKPPSLQEVSQHLLSEYQCYPVFLGEELKYSYYKRACCGACVFWQYGAGVGVSE